MAITYPLTLPATNGECDLADMEITNINAVSVAVSPYTGVRQKQDWSRNQLVVRATTIPMQKANALKWWSFLRALRSGLGTFYMGDPHNTVSQGTAATSPGAPLVAGGSQTGNSLNIDGCPANETGWLLDGDWIQLGSGSSSRLYTVVGDVDTNGSGEATIEFMPALRSSPADNATVTIADTVGVFELMEDVAFPVNQDHLYVLQFAAIEVP